MISPEEFASYTAVTVAAKSKYGTIYHVSENTDRGFKDEFLVYERTVNGEKDGLFKMDYLTRVENDSTFMFYSPPLKQVADTMFWPKGMWFYTRKKGEETYYSADSMPKNHPLIDYQRVSPGIYYYENKKMVRVSNAQSDDAFDKVYKAGFYYLPNPGCLYILVKLSDIK